MPKRLIIAVGGSGQTVVSHYLRYATMAGVPGEELPDIYILDADLKESIRETEAKPSLYGEIKKLHGRLVAGLSPSRRPSLHLLYPYNSDTALTSKQTFADYLIGNRPGRDDFHKQRILDGLFATSEQELKIAEGFFARPNVGATAIFDKLHAGENDRALKLLRQGVTHPDAPRVVVIGSTFGGTGSGGAPVIAQKLREWAGDRNKVKIGVFLTLPWFSPGDLGKTFTDDADTLGKWETQWKNTAAGLRFYGSSRVFLNDLDVFIADYNGEKHPRHDDSNTGQPEYPHCFNIILAAQIQNYLTRAVPENEDPGQYSFYFVASQSNHRAMQLDGYNCPLLRFSVPTPGSEMSYLRQDLADWAIQTQTLRLTLGKVADYIQRDFHLSDGSKRRRPDTFVNLALAVANSCQNEPGAFIETGFGPFRKPEAGPKIYGSLVSSLNDRAEQLGTVIAWLQDAWEQSKKMPALTPACTTWNPSAIWDSYPALNGERNAEVAAIKLFDDAFTHAYTIAADFQESVGKGQQEPFHAAAAIIEKLLREAILARAGQGRHGQSDEQPPNLGNNQIASALVPMQVQTNLRNHYAISLDLKHILDHGRNRQGDSLSIFNESHPATLTGVTHYNVPSPWAAGHLNAWIQASGFDPVQPTAQWLKAKQQLEAVLWGIFTKRLHVHSVPFKDLSRLGNILYGALSAEMFGYKLIDRWDKIVYATATDTEGKELTVAINHPVCGWFSAPGLQEQDLWWEKFEISLPSALRPTNPDSLEAKQLKAFVDFLQNQLINNSHTEDSIDQAGWYRITGILADELRHILPNSVIGAEIASTSNGFFLLDKHNETIFQVPLIHLLYSAQQLIAEYCVSEVAVVALGEGFRPADSPLKSAYIGKQGINAELIAQTRDSQDRPAVRYNLSLGQHGVLDSVFPARVMESFSTHTEIWPNFKTQNWKIYFLASATSNDNLVRDYGFSVFDEAGNRVGYANRSFTHNHEIHGTPEFLVMEFIKDKEPRELGMFNFGLNSLAVSDKFLNLAVDFGTSHSCVYATTTNDESARIALDISKPSEKLGRLVFDHPAVKKTFLVENNTFLPGYCGLAQTTDNSVLPTEFRLIGSPKRNDLKAGVKSFDIIPMRFPEASLEERLRTSNILLGGFKWPGALNGTDFEREETGLTQEYLRQFLLVSTAMLKSMGYGRLTMFRATYPEAFSYAQRMTYTEALTETLNTVLAETGFSYVGTPILEAQQLLEIASSQMSDTQRSSLQKDSSGMVSESMAALLSASSRDYNFFAERGICIVMDMGGGTTDIAAYFSPGSGKRDASKSIDSITDSVRYAGHDLLRLLATPQIINNILKSNQWDGKDENSCFDALKVLVRDPEHFKRLKNNFSNSEYLPETRERMQLFFEGLFEYIRLLTLAYQKSLAADGQKWVINIALFGNAWKLSELAYHTREQPFDGFINYFKNYLNAALGQNQDIHIRYEGLRDASIKEAIAAGALRFNALDRQFVTPKEHASLAGLDMVCHPINGKDFDVPYDDFLAGFDRLQFDQNTPVTVKSLASLRERPLMETLRIRYGKRDDEWITHQVAAAINQAIREPWIMPGVREAMKFSPMRLFLEQVWKETVKVVPLNQTEH